MAAARATNDNRVRPYRQAFVTLYNNFAGLGDISCAKHSQLLVRTVGGRILPKEHRRLCPPKCNTDEPVAGSGMRLPTLPRRHGICFTTHAAVVLFLLPKCRERSLSGFGCDIDAKYHQTHPRKYSANLRGIVQARPIDVEIKQHAACLRIWSVQPVLATS